MSFDESILKSDERAVYELRALYRDYGYSQYKMSKFEEYDLYSENKDFLVSDGVITFNDTNGKLLALKPDVTLSILKNFKDEAGAVERLYYNENVYRISETSHTYKEIMQTGLECIGDINGDNEAEVIILALKSLALISKTFVLDLSHVGLVSALLDGFGLEGEKRKVALNAVVSKNGDLLRETCGEEAFSELKCLIKSFKNSKEALECIGEICKTDKAKQYAEELQKIFDRAQKEGFGDNINIDFSIVDSAAYYSGAVFKGYIDGAETRVLSGGRYDGLMRKMGRRSGGIGFAVYLDALERADEKAGADSGYINVALPKGRLGEKVYSMFERAGFPCPSIKENNRKLIFENAELGLRFFWVKPSDVAIYVERGAADIGVAGKDILLEYEPDVYELLDLKLGICRMAVAGKKDFKDDTSKTLRVATKFSNIARQYYAEKCRDIDIIHLNGSIELAPILGLSDVIVDIVETGKTLLENNLEPFETIVPISARLISNKASFKFKAEKIEKIKKGLLGLTENEQ